MRSTRYQGRTNLCPPREVPTSCSNIKTVQVPNCNYSNGQPVNIVGTVSLNVRFGSYVVRCDFFLCEHFTTTYVLGGDFFDRFVNAIKPRKKIVELDNGTEVPIVRKRTKNDIEMLPLPSELNNCNLVGRISHKILAAKDATLEPQRQATVGERPNSSA